MGFLSKLFKPITDFLGDMIGFLTGVDFDDIENQAPAVLVNKQSNVAALPVIYGRRKVGGVRVYIGTGGNKNKYLYIALALCEGEIEAIESIYINDRLIQFDANGSVLTSRSSSFYGNKIKVQKFLGKDTGQVDGATHTYSTILAEQTEWTSSHKLKGVAYLALRIQHDKDKHGGIPDIKCIVKGRKVYDPRDSTTAYSNNPALCLRDYLTNTRYGKGLPTSAIDDTTGRAGFQTAADSCDDASYTVAPFFQAGYTVHLLECNARLDTNKTIFSNVKEMLQGMRGLMPYSEGKYGLIIDEAYTADANTFDLTPDNITSDITVQQSGKGKRFNRVIVNFPNPNANWQQDSVMFPEKSTDSNDDYLTFLSEDNDEELVKEVQCNTITSLYAARELARVICLASRKNVNAVKLTATSEALNIAVGDVVRLEHPSLGWTNSNGIDARQLMRVSNLQMQDDGEVGLSLVEHNNSIYTFLQGSEEPDNLESSFSGIFDIDAPTGLGATENTIIGGDGSLQPAIVVSWIASDDEFVREYEVQWKKSTDTAYQVAFTTEVEYSIAPVEVDYDNPITYDIRVRAINSADVASDFVTTTEQVDGDDTAPAKPTEVTLIAGINQITCTWKNPTDADYAFTEVHISHLSGTPADSASPTAKISGEEYILTGLSQHQRFFHLRAVDFNGNKSDYTDQESAQALLADSDDIADDAIGADEINDDEVLHETPVGGLAHYWPCNSVADVDGDGDEELQEVVAGKTGIHYGTTAPTVTTDSPTGKATSLGDENGFILLNDADADALEHTFTAGSFVSGTSYVIKQIGTTDFTAIGASANTVGTTFTATGAGTGTGVARVSNNAGFAWSMWFKSTTASGNNEARLINRDPSDSWAILIDQSGASQTVTFYGEPDTESVATISTDEWHHIAFSEDGQGTIQIYFDGEAGNTETYTPVVSNVPVGIGSDIENGTIRFASYEFVGLISEIRAYNRALTAQEVRALYKNPAAGSPAEVDGDMIIDGSLVAAKITVANLAEINDNVGTITEGELGGVTIDSDKLYQGTGDWANSNTGFYLDDTGKFSLKDKLFFNPTNSRLTVAGNVTADTITVNDQLEVFGPLQASALADGTITREHFSQDAIDFIFGQLAPSVGGSNGDYKEASGNFTGSGGTVTVGSTSDKFDHGTLSVDVEFLCNHYFFITSNPSATDRQVTLNFEVSADGTFTDLTSATKTHTLEFNEYDLSSYYGYTYFVVNFNGEVTKTFTTGTGNDLVDNTDYIFRVRVDGVGSAFSGQTVPFTVEANEGVTGVESTTGNATTLDGQPASSYLRSDEDDTFDGDLTVTGQLILQGSIDQYNVTDLDVTDKTITVNSGNTQSLSDGAGLIVDRGSASDASLTWDETNDRFDLSHPINVSGNITVPEGQIVSDGTSLIIDGDDGKEVEIRSARDIRLVIDDNNDDTTNEFHIYKHSVASSNELLTIDQSGNADFSGTINSGSITSSGNITASGGASNITAGTTTGYLYAKSLRLVNGEVADSDFQHAYQMIVDANDSLSIMSNKGDFDGGYPFGIFFLGDNGGTTKTLGSGLVGVWNTTNFKKAHVDHMVGLYDGTQDLTAPNISVTGNLDVVQSIRHTGDTDTAINFFSDQVEIRTGGTPRLSITNSDFIFTNTQVRFDATMGIGAITYAPIESNTEAERNWLNIHRANDASYIEITNRTPAGKVVLSGGLDGGGGEVQRLEIEGGSSTKSVKVLASTDLNLSTTSKLTHGTTTILDASRNLAGIESADIDGFVLENSAHRTGLLSIPQRDSGNSYTGIQLLRDNGEHWQLMASDTIYGAYEDTTGKWIWQATKSEGTRLYYNGANKLETVDDGVEITGSLFAAATNIDNAFDFQVTDSAANSNKTGMRLDYNASDNTTLTADRTHIGFEIDYDVSSTGGDTSNEYRAYALSVDLRGAGDTDLRRGVYSYTETQHDAGTVSENVAVYGYAVADETGTGRTTNNYGGIFLAYENGTGSGGTNTHYGVFAKAHANSLADKDIGSMYGVYAEVEYDTTGATTAISTIYGVRSVIDNDSTDTTLTNSYLFHASYEGTINATNAYGLYINGNVENYFAGHVRADQGYKVGSSTIIDASANLTNIGSITASGTHTFTANDVDFIVQDTTDSVTNYIWRDHSNDKLYLGTGNAVVDLRSVLKINNTERIDMSGNATLGTISSGAISAAEQSVFTGNAISGTPNSNAQIVAADSGVAGIAIHSNDGGQGYLWFGDNTNNAVGRIYYNHSTDKVHWRVGGTDDAHTLDSSGNATFAGDITAQDLTLLSSSGHTRFTLGSRSGDPTPSSDGSYDFRPGMRVSAFEPSDGSVDGDADLPLAWNGSLYLAGTQTYATASADQVFTFSVNFSGGTRWFAKVKTNDAESGNYPYLAVNAGTEYALEYFDAPPSNGENDSDAWHVIDITDDVVTGSNTLKVWLGGGQKTYVLAIYVYPSTGIMLPNEPYESVGYFHKGIGVGDSRILDEDANLSNIGTLSSGAITTSGSITTSGTLDFTANPAYIRNDQDDQGQIVISAKNSSSQAQQVRWDAANNTAGAWRPETTNVSDLGLTNRIWNTLYINLIKHGASNDTFLDQNLNVTANNVYLGSTNNSDYLSGNSRLSIDGYMMVKGIINTEETGTGATGITFGNGSTLGTDQISLITSGARQFYISSTGVAQFSEDVLVLGDNLDIQQSLRHNGNTDTRIEFTTNQMDFKTSATARLTIDTAAVTIKDDLIVEDGSPVITISDTSNGGGGGAEGKIIFKNTEGNAIGIGYTGDVITDSDLIISTDADGTYGTYLGLDAAGISDTQSDIILEPKTSVRIANGDLKVGTSTVISSTGRFYASDGTNAKAAFSFDSESNTGIYKYGSGQIGFTVGGTLKAYIQDSTYSLVVSGKISSTGGNSDNWNTAYGWGDHASAGYLSADSYDTQVCHLKTNVSAAVDQGVGNEFTVNFNLEEHNDSSTFSHSSGVVTVATAGWYRIYANMVYQNGSSSARNTVRAYVEKNGTEITSTATYDYDRGSSYGEFSNNKIETMLYLAANDTIGIGNYAENEDGVITIEAAECEFIVSSVSAQTSSTNADTVDGLHASSFIRSDAADTVSGAITFNSDVYVSNRIYHAGDTNTYLDFTGDRVRIISGSIEMIDCVESTTDYVDIVDRVRVTAGGDLECEGNITAYTSTSISDINQKENIQRIKSPIEKIKAISGYTFDWKQSGEHSGGVIAQEIEQVMPDIVKEKSIRDGEKMKAVDYQAIIGLLVETVKDLNQRIEELENGDD